MRPATRRRLLVSASLIFASGYISLHAQQPSSDADDKYIWLEDVSSARSMDWVKAENARTAKVLEGDPRFAAYQADALKIAEDPNRLASPSQFGDDIYNFWRDAAHTHGIFRKTTLSSYLTPQPDWHTVIDFDALGKKEGVNWVNHGSNCLYPEDHYCLFSFSSGGEDASTEREFDLKSGTFVDGGFVLPHSKQNVGWVDKDTLLVAREWGPDSMTQSGYPYILKLWKRGTPLDSAKEVFRGKPSDQIGSFASSINDGQGHHAILIQRGVTFFEFETYLYTPDGKVVQLAIPKKSNIIGMLDGHVLLQTSENWTPAGSKTTFVQGSLLQMELKDIVADPAHLKPTAVFTPTSQEFLEGASTSKSRLIVTTLNHVRGRAYIYTPTPAGWSKKLLAVPDNVSVHIVTTGDVNDQFFLAVTGFLTPSSVWLGDAVAGTIKVVKTAPAQFDASNDVVEQFEATSKDGTKVPYFVVHRKDIVYNGENPTLLNAYGGFEVSETPNYSAVGGKLWLEHGGVSVLANIRGGGEFGPAWHEAGLKTKRQHIYDDFAAVGQDLITRKITSPRHLGIIGGSNGGLLMGVEMTQHPDLWNAVVIQVPLLDMLRFEKIAAGASWVGEYGSVSNPEERAFLAGISPYNQLKPNVKYPEPLIFTTTKDDRVGPQHARKFAAKMEEFHEPFLYDEIIEGGHGAGADLKEEARTWAETYVYLARKLMSPAATSATP
jgi:prolyl oligopeptidase